MNLPKPEPKFALNAQRTSNGVADASLALPQQIGYQQAFAKREKQKPRVLSADAP
jgi:hypothetical protein